MIAINTGGGIVPRRLEDNMSYEYKAKIIEGMTIEEIDKELEEMAYNEWAYGRSIDRPRMWDLYETKKHL